MNRRAAAWSGALPLWASQATVLYLVLSPFSKPIAMVATFLFGASRGWKAARLER